MTCDKFRVGLVCDKELVGVAMPSRPVAIALDDGKTIEIVRVCVKEGYYYPNACSMLYGRITKLAKLMGFERVITYTLQKESQTSMKAIGAILESEVKPTK